MAHGQQQQSRLLRLPAELQLIIWEYVLIEDEPLLLNCPCDSSYDDDEEWSEDQHLWSTGDKSAPSQPSLTRTCSAIRDITLEIFYERNAFRGHYCERADLNAAIEWLTCIGPKNRRLLNDCAFWDFNWRYDEWSPKYLTQLKRSEMCRGLGGCLASAVMPDHLCHRVSFKDDQGDGSFEELARLFDIVEKEI